MRIAVSPAAQRPRDAGVHPDRLAPARALADLLMADKPTAVIAEPAVPLRERAPLVSRPPRGRSQALLPFIAAAVLLAAWQILAQVFAHSRRLEAALYPIAVFVNTIPILAKAPILVLIFGLGMTSKVVIAAFICFFPTLANMVRGLTSVNPQSLELMRVLSASRGEVFWKLRVPSSLPFLFSALKIASTTSVLGAIVGEWIGADLGLGALIIEATHNFRSPLLYATVFVASGWAVIFFAVVSFAERRIVTWKQGEVS